MKSLIVLLLLTTTAFAQSGNPLPQTIDIKNNATGEVIGKLTRDGNRAFIRGLNGEFLAQIIKLPDGTRKALDEHGKEISKIEFPKAIKGD